MNRTALLLFLFGVLPLVGCRLGDRVERVGEGVAPERPGPVVPPAPGGDAPPARPQAVVLMVPGLDFDRVERGMREGWLPNLRRLRTGATLVPLVHVPPADLAAEATLWTAVPPARHGVLGDLVQGTVDGRPAAVPAAWRVERVPQNEALAAADDRLPAEVPVVRSRVDAGPLLAALAAAGRRVLVLRSGLALHAGTGDARVLGAGALPDLSFGRAGYVMAVEDEAAPERRVTTHGGTVVRALPDTRGRDVDVFHVPVAGPPRLAGADGLAVVRLEVRATRDRARAVVVTDEERVTIQAGVWSEPIGLRFPVAPGLAIHGRARVYLRPTGRRQLELYVEPPDVDPLRPPPWQPVARPAGLPLELTRLHGPLPRFAGSGFPAAAVADGLLSGRDAAAALAAAFTAEQALFTGELVRGDFDLLFQSFSVIDEVLRLGAGTAEEVDFLGLRVPRDRLVEAALAAVDALVGSALDVAAARRGCAVFLVSPHGGRLATRCFDPNAWLADRGDLVLRGPLDVPLADRIDWSRTRAYVLGAGHVHLNVLGREPDGFLRPEHAAAYQEGLVRDLLRSRSGEAHVVSSVWSRQEYGDGPGAPDLILGLAPGFAIDQDVQRFRAVGRVFEGTSRALPGAVATIDPTQAAGLLAVSRRLPPRDVPATLEDVAATLAAWFDVAPPEGATGTALPLGPALEPAPRQELERRPGEPPRPWRGGD